MTLAKLLKCNISDPMFLDYQCDTCSGKLACLSDLDQRYVAHKGGPVERGTTGSPLPIQKRGKLQICVEDRRSTHKYLNVS
jgi:hypothetical protein